MAPAGIDLRKLYAAMTAHLLEQVFGGEEG